MEENKEENNLLKLPSAKPDLDRKDTAYLRTITQHTGDNPQDLDNDEAAESSEYESFEDETIEMEEQKE